MNRDQKSTFDDTHSSSNLQSNLISFQQTWANWGTDSGFIFEVSSTWSSPRLSQSRVIKLMYLLLSIDRLLSYSRKFGFQVLCCYNKNCQGGACAGLLWPTKICLKPGKNLMD